MTELFTAVPTVFNVFFTFETGCIILLAALSAVSSTCSIFLHPESSTAVVFSTALCTFSFDAAASVTADLTCSILSISIAMTGNDCRFMLFVLSGILFTASAACRAASASFLASASACIALSILALVASDCCCSFSILVSTAFIFSITALPFSPAMSLSDIAAISLLSCFHFSCASSIFSLVSSRLLFRRSIGSEGISKLPTSISGSSSFSLDFFLSLFG